MLRQGTYQDLVNSDLDFAQLLERPKPPESVSTLATEQDEDIPYIDDDHDGYQALRKQSKAVSETSIS